MLSNTFRKKLSNIERIMLYARITKNENLKVSFSKRLDVAYIKSPKIRHVYKDTLTNKLIFNISLR